MPSLTPLHFQRVSDVYVKDTQAWAEMHVLSYNPAEPLEDTRAQYGGGIYFTNCGRFRIKREPDGWSVVARFIFLPSHQWLVDVGLDTARFPTRRALMDILTELCEEADMLS